MVYVLIHVTDVVSTMLAAHNPVWHQPSKERRGPPGTSQKSQRSRETPDHEIGTMIYPGNDLDKQGNLAEFVTQLVRMIRESRGISECVCPAR